MSWSASLRLLATVTGRAASSPGAGARSYRFPAVSAWPLSASSVDGRACDLEWLADWPAPTSADGASCTSGLDCCCGYCLTDANGANGTCSCEPPECSKINEKCETAADCCEPTDPDAPTPDCLGGYCGFVVVE